MNKDLDYSRTAVVFSPTESLWKILLSEQLYEKAWGAKLETTWQPGSEIRFRGTWEGVEYFDKGIVQMNAEHKILKYSYWSSFWETADHPDEYCLIIYKIHPLDDMTCEFTLVQAGFRDEKHYTDTVEVLDNLLDTVKVEAERLYLASFCKDVFDNLLPLITPADRKLYNDPVTDGWSAGQVTEHVIMSSSGLSQFLSEASPSSIPYDKHVPAIRAMMRDTTQKLKTADFLVPPYETFDQQQHIEQLGAIASDINRCIETFDFRRRCESFALPPFGHLSVFEWLTFTTCHISRHTSQLESRLRKNET